MSTFTQEQEAILNGGDTSGKTGGTFDRLLKQESGGRQFNTNGGVVTSSKGATGIAQVMPATGPEAAKLAGVEWNPERFKSDPEYNKSLGRAYFDKQLATFGNERLALAAYNAGPGAVQKAIQRAEKSGGDPLAYLPEETQKYVPAILGAGFGVKRAASSPWSQQPKYVDPGFNKAIEQDAKNEAIANEGYGAAFAHGFGDATDQIPEMAVGAGTALADVFGADELRDAGLEYLQKRKEAHQDDARPYSSFTDSLANGDMGRWASYALGYGTNQLAQAVATGGIGATIGKVGLTGLLKGTAERATAEALAKGAAKEIAGKAGMQAAEIAARKYGAAFTMSGYTYGQELGSIYPDAVEQAKKTGNPVDLARVFGAAGVAAALEVAPEIGIAGKLIEGVGKGSKRMVGRAATTIPKQMGLEGGTEYLQTGAEQWGAQKPLDTPEAQKERVDSAAMGAIMGGPAGAIEAIPAPRDDTATTVPGAVPGAAPGAQPAGTPPAQPTITPNSPLANAASIAQAAAPQPAAVDPFNGRLSAMQSFVEDKAFIQALRGAQGYGPESVTEALSAFAKARNPNLDPLVREHALSDLEGFVQSFNGRPNFTFGNRQAEPQPGQQVAPFQQPGGAVGPATTPDDGRTLNGEVITRPGTMAGANPNQISAPPVLGLPTEEALQAKRDADAAYEQAYQDLVKPESLGASDQDLAAKQQAIREARAAREQADARMQDIERAIDGGRQQQTTEKRRAVLDAILADPATANPAARLAAELKRQGFRDTTPTQAELDTVQRFSDIKNAKAEPDIIPSSPNELDPYQVRQERPGQPAKPRLTVEQIKQAIANGATLSKDVLTLPDGSRVKLKGPQIAAAREAIRKAQPEQVESAPDQANESDVSPQPDAPQQVESRTYTPPTSNKEVSDSWYGVWKRGTTQNQEVLMAAVQKARDAGLYYNKDVNNFVAKELGVTDDDLAVGSDTIDGGAFGYDVYHARNELDRRAADAANSRAVDELGLSPGVKLGVLVFNDGKVIKAVEIQSVSEDKQSVTINGKRGKNTVSGPVSPVSIKRAIERAEERGARKPATSANESGQTKTVEPPAETFDVSTHTDDQLRYLAEKGKAGWREAAQAELAKRTPADVSLTNEGKTTQPVEPEAENVDPLDKEISDAAAHLADVLADVFGAKLNITGPQHSAADLLPAMQKVIGLLVQKGFKTFAQAVGQTARMLRDNGAGEHVEKITPRQWKAAYQFAADMPGVEGAESEESVAALSADKVQAIVSGHVDKAKAEAEARTDTNPSDAQKEAENYRKGKFSWNGQTIAVENPKGSERTGKGEDGTEWRTVMPATYGYFLGTVGADKDHVDVFMGDTLDAPNFWVINQTQPDSAKFDEHKVVAGVTSADEAKRIYLDSFSDGFGDKVFSSIAGPYPVGELADVLPKLKAKKPFGVKKESPRDAHIRAKEEAYAARREGQPVPPKALEIVRTEAGKEFDKAEATHKDPGQPAEAVTPDVVAQSIRKSAANTPLDVKEAKAYLLAEIDKAILAAGDKSELEAELAREKAKEFDGKDMEKRGIGSKQIIAARDAFNALRDSNIAKTVEQIGFVTFDVPGDGKFKVANSAAKLQEFRRKVETSPGFKSPATKPPIMRSETNTGSYGPRDAILDGDYLNAYELAKLQDKPLVFSVGTNNQKPTAYTDTSTADGIIDGISFVVGREATKDGKWFVIEPATGILLNKNGLPSKVAALTASKALTKGKEDALRKVIADPAKAMPQSTLEAEWLAWAEKEEGVMLDRQAEAATNEREREEARKVDEERKAESEATKKVHGKPHGWMRDGVGLGGVQKQTRIVARPDGSLIQGVMYETAGRFDHGHVELLGAAGSAEKTLLSVGRQSNPDEAQAKIDAYLDRTQGPVETNERPVKQENDAESDAAALSGVPETVQRYVRRALDGLNEVHRRLQSVERARGRGHILATEWRDAQPEVKSRNEALAKFRDISKGNGTDAEAVIRALGGEPDFSGYTMPEPSAPIAESVTDDAPDLDPLETAIPGVSEILRLSKSVRNDGARYSSQFSRMMEDEGNDGARPPKLTNDDAEKRLKEMLAANPRAAQYVRALAFEDASNYMKAAAGTKAKNMLLAGESAEKAKGALDDWTGEKAKLEESKLNDTRLREIMTRENGWDVVENMPEFFSPEWRGLQDQGYKMYMLGRDGNPIENTLNGSVMAKPLSADSENADARKAARSDVGQPSDLTGIFSGLSSRGLAKNRAQKAAEAHPRAAQIAYVQDNFMDILTELEDSGLVKINCD